MIKKLSLEEQKRREALRKKMMAARSPEEIRDAQQAARRWLRKHPGDTMILSLGEKLYMLRG